jgi:hypothetical protein
MVGNDFVYSSPMRCLSKTFLEQIVEQLEASDETFASAEL